MKKVVDQNDADSLKWGEGFYVEIPGFNELADDPDGPLKLIESDEFKHAQKLEQTVMARFDTGRDDPFTVTVGETHITVQAVTDVVAVLGGDVRDSEVKLPAGASTRRKLTREGHGFVTVNGTKYFTPKREA